ncbi:hypothetical protein [Deinococcus sp. QL22]|uniref:hypothetical protein n=1 Tax=Deinococcus sp. QL22 TaxID=2939437 RepID=UPI002017FAAF|nr:hypothetical protein [Deinococcus sp. QL22]UQN09294.1 hypothetical protein M1R55_22225 [Deinococcus sp. QL22]
MPTDLAEITRTDNLSRELWLKFIVDEIRNVTLVARLEAATSNDNMIMLAVRSLDGLIGAMKPPKVVVLSVSAGKKVLGPVDLSHLDSHLLEGARWAASWARASSGFSSQRQSAPDAITSSSGSGHSQL